MDRGAEMRRAAVVLAAVLAAMALPAAGQEARPRSIAGTVTKFRPARLEFGIEDDAGQAETVKVGPRTDVVQVAPGDRDLSRAKPARFTDILLGDRLLVTFVDGMVEARRVVLIAADDIARRNETERADWERRGIAGSVAAVNGNEITLEVRDSKGASNTVLVVTPKTTIRRYAPDSVKFTEAVAAPLAEVERGDQVKARGDLGADGRLTAEDIVFGTFRTIAGTVTAVDAETGTVAVADMATNETITVRITADSRLRMLPDMRKMFGAMLAGRGGHAPDSGSEAEPATRADILKMFDRLPAGKFVDLKTGSALIASSTRGSRPGQVTAIMVLANADSLLQMAQTQAAGQPGATALDVIGRMHGGMMGGPGGLSLPAMIQ